MKINGIEYEPDFTEPKVDHIEMWYDRHRRNWVLYPVDAEGNQLKEARYGFGKAEALEIKKELEDELMKGERT